MSWQDIENVLLTSLTNAAAKRIDSNKAAKTKPKTVGASMSGIDVGAIMRAMGMGNGGGEDLSQLPGVVAAKGHNPDWPFVMDEDYESVKDTPYSSVEQMKYKMAEEEAAKKRKPMTNVASQPYREEL